MVGCFRDRRDKMQTLGCDQSHIPQDLSQLQNDAFCRGRKVRSTSRSKRTRWQLKSMLTSGKGTSRFFRRAQGLTPVTVLVRPRTGFPEQSAVRERNRSRIGGGMAAHNSSLAVSVFLNPSQPSAKEDCHWSLRFGRASSYRRDASVVSAVS